MLFKNDDNNNVDNNDEDDNYNLVPLIEGLCTKYCDTLSTLWYFLFVTTLWIRYNNLHFRNEQTEVQRKLGMYPMLHSFVRGFD